MLWNIQFYPKVSFGRSRILERFRRFEKSAVKLLKRNINQAIGIFGRSRRSEREVHVVSVNGPPKLINFGPHSPARGK